MVALRTQQVIAEETGVTNTIDPLGGSYAVEALTDRMEREANDYIRRIDEMGGMVKAIETGYPQREIAEAAFHFQRQLEQGIKTVVGVNKYSIPEEIPIATLKIDAAIEERQIQRVRKVKRERNSVAVKEALARVAAGVPLRREPDGTDLRGGAPRCDRRRGLRHLSRRVRRVQRPRLDLAMADKRLRILVAKPGLDGHDRGAKIIARALRDGGFEVIYTGLHQTPEMIAEAAVQEDADAVGLSVLSGAHMTLFPEVMRLLKERGAGEIAVFGGGIIPDDDAVKLKQMGVRQIFTPGASTEDIVKWVRENVAPRT